MTRIGLRLVLIIAIGATIGCDRVRCRLVTSGPNSGLRFREWAALTCRGGRRHAESLVHTFSRRRRDLRSWWCPTSSIGSRMER